MSYNRIVAAPGQNINLGTEGGSLLLGPPGAAPGAMSLTDLQNRTWHLLREDGPDTGYAAPTTGDFPIQVVTRDLNIAFADFISQTGIAPGLVERMDTFAVFAGEDCPVPPGLQSITQIEYNPAGGQTYYLQPKSLAEFVSATGGIIPPTIGQPRYFREPFAGYIRLQPAPGAGQATADTMTWYYTAVGNLLVNPGDTPAMPPQFHMALVYRVLADYWDRKQDATQADRYMKKFDLAVARGKAFTFDSNRASQPTTAGDDYDEPSWPMGGG